MLGAVKFGFGTLPPTKCAVAFLIVPSDDILRPEAWCHPPQCQVMDDLLSKTYDACCCLMLLVPIALLEKATPDYFCSKEQRH